MSLSEREIPERPEKERARIILVRASTDGVDQLTASRLQWIEGLLEAVIRACSYFDLEWLTSCEFARGDVAARGEAASAVLIHLHSEVYESPSNTARTIRDSIRGLPAAVFGGLPSHGWYEVLAEAGVRLILKGLPEPEWLRHLAGIDGLSSTLQKPVSVIQPSLSGWSLLPGGVFQCPLSSKPALLVRGALGRSARPAWCGAAAAEGPLRERPAQFVRGEIQELTRRQKFHSIELADYPVDLGSPAAMRALLELMGGVGDGPGWVVPVDASIRPHEGCMADLAIAGVRRVRLSLPSVSDRMCRRLSATTDPACSADVIRQARLQGVLADVTLMVGAPGETREDRLAAAEWVAGLSDCINILGLMPFRPQPGSEIACYPERFGIWWPPGGGLAEWVDRQGSNLVLRAKFTHEIAAHGRALGVSTEVYGAPRVADVDRSREKVIERIFLTQGPQPAREVVLATTPPWGTANPPVGLGYLAEALTAAGMGCRIVDGNAVLFQQVDPHYRHLWHYENKNFWSCESTFRTIEAKIGPLLDLLVDRIVSDRPLLIGLSVVDPKELCTVALTRRIHSREPTIPVVLGGPACLEPGRRRMLAELLEGKSAGFVVGEGEETLVELARRLAAGQGCDGVPGFIPMTDPCRLVEGQRIDLGSVRFPKYRPFESMLYGDLSLIVQWSRGCIGTCNFCKGHEVEGKYRHRNPDDVVDELQWNVNRGIRDFTVCDSEVNGSIRFLSKVCDGILDRGLDLKWRGQAIPHHGMEAELLEKMQRSGCSEIQYGIESGSNAVLARMGKGRMFKIPEAEEVIRLTHQAGISVSVFLIVGHPGEGEPEFEETLGFLRRNAEIIDSIKSVNTLHVIEDTELHRDPARFGVRLPGSAWHRDWQSLDGVNTPQLRRKRTLRVLQIARELGIPVLEHNLGDEKAEAVAEEITESPNPEASLWNAIRTNDELRAAGTTTMEVDSRKKAPLTAKHSGPEMAEIELSAACNIRCIGCWCHSPLLKDNSHFKHQRERPLPTERICEILTEMAELGTKAVQFSGTGEPLMNADAVEIIAHASSIGLRTTLVTNGTLLTAEVANALARSGLDSVTASVWAGDSPTYQRTHPGSRAEDFSILTDRLKHFTRMREESGKPDLKLYHVISRVNAGSLETMIDHALEVDADQVEFQLIDILPGAEGQLRLRQDDIAAIEQALVRLRARQDFTDFWAGRPPLIEGAPDVVLAEVQEFGRFIRRGPHKILVRNGPKVQCERGEVSELGAPGGVYSFIFPVTSRLCRNCELNGQCFGNREQKSFVLSTLELTGMGSFLRRVRASAEATTAKERDIVLDLPCEVGNNFTRVDYQGNVLACCKGSGKPLGNVSACQFASIWNSVAYKEFRRNARELRKDHPYFDSFGCLQGCDNLGMNLRARYLLRDSKKKRGIK